MSVLAATGAASGIAAPLRPATGAIGGGATDFHQALRDAARDPIAAPVPTPTSVGQASTPPVGRIGPARSKRAGEALAAGDADPAGPETAPDDGDAVIAAAPTACLAQLQAVMAAIAGGPGTPVPVVAKPDPAPPPASVAGQRSPVSPGGPGAAAPMPQTPGATLEPSAPLPMATGDDAMPAAALPSPAATATPVLPCDQAVAEAAFPHPTCDGATLQIEPKRVMTASGVQRAHADPTAMPATPASRNDRPSDGGATSPGGTGSAIVAPIASEAPPPDLATASTAPATAPANTAPATAADAAAADAATLDTVVTTAQPVAQPVEAPLLSAVAGGAGGNRGRSRARETTVARERTGTPTSAVASAGGGGAVAAPVPSFFGSGARVTGGELAAAATARAAPGDQAADQATDRHLDLARDGQWLDGLAHDIAKAADIAAPLRFALQPTHLGRLDVQLQTVGESTTIRLGAETREAHRILSAAQPQLVADARAQGLRVSDTRVELSPNGSGTGTHQSFGNQNSGGGSQPDRSRVQPLPSVSAPAAVEPANVRDDALYA